TNLFVGGNGGSGVAAVGYGIENSEASSALVLNAGENGTVTFQAGEGISQPLDSLDITADALRLLGAGFVYDFTSGPTAYDIEINTLAADTGSVTLEVEQPLAIGTVADTEGATVSGRLTLISDSEVTQTAAITAPELLLLGDGAIYLLGHA